MSSRNKQRLVIVVSAVWAVFLITVGLSPKAQDKIHTGWHNWKSGASSTLRIEPVQAGKTVIFERFVHDEVTGALAYSLSLVGVEAILNIHMRHNFKQVLDDILPYEPEYTNVLANPAPMKEYLSDPNVSNIVLTTCRDSLRLYHEEIKASKAHIICVVHHSGGSFRNDFEHMIKELAEERRISILTLASHVGNMVVDDLREWADLIDFQPYAEIPVEIFIPVFEYPPNRTWSQPEIFPSKTVIQGNIEHGRRNYEKIFEQLSEAVKADPALWGYREITEDGIQTFVALESETSPFELRLLGQVVKSDPLSIPDELKHMVTIHESLPYPEFYDMAADADILIPAFRQRGTFENTASSTMGTAMIVRTPVLASDRHIKGYTYIRGPACVSRDVGEPEVSALARLRRESIEARRSGAGSTRPPGARQENEWRLLLDSIHFDNSLIWPRFLK